MSHSEQVRYMGFSSASLQSTQPGKASVHTFGRQGRCTGFGIGGVHLLLLGGGLSQATPGGGGPWKEEPGLHAFFDFLAWKQRSEQVSESQHAGTCILNSESLLHYSQWWPLRQENSNSLTLLSMSGNRVDNPLWLAKSCKMHPFLQKELSAENNNGHAMMFSGWDFPIMLFPGYFG